jgi:hypothetical protein
MKRMNSLLIAIALFTFLPALSAQPPLWAPPYQVEAEKNSSHYCSKAKDFLKDKNKNYRAAAANAITCLAMEPNKRQIKKALEALIEALPQAYSESEKRLAHLNQAGVPFSGDGSANMAYEVVKIYRELIYINELYSGLTPDRLEGFSFELKDYTQELQGAEERLEETRRQAAAMHYEKGRQYDGSQLREENLLAAKAFHMTDLYVPEYEDARQRFNAVYPLAVCYFGLGEIRNNSGKGNFLINELRNSIHALSDYPIQRKKLTYFRLLPSAEGFSNKANVRFEAEISNIVFNRKEGDPSTKEREAEIEENGQKKKVKATITFRNRSAEAKAEGHYTITDLQTGQVMESKPFTAGYSWYHSWATYSGDIRALKKSEKKEVEDKDKPYPTDQSLTDSVIHDVANKLAGAISRFSESYR